MNRYSRQAHDHYRHHRPADLAEMNDPVRHFTEIGDQAQTAITELRDQILGQPAQTENLEDYRQRSYQALRQAEEIVMAEILTPSGPDERRPTSAASGTEAQTGLSLVNDTLSTLDGTWTETPASTP
jgi:hypothetical protein